MTDKKLKIVWICSISNQQIYSHIKFATWNLKNIVKYILRKPVSTFKEWAQWNTNAIQEFEKFEDIQLTVIFPYPDIKGKMQRFSINGIEYICYETDDTSLCTILKRHLGLTYRSTYPRERKMVKSLIKDIKPDIIHVIGAENPHYSICALDVPSDIPLVVSLQTLMSEPSFKKNYPIDEESYQYRSSIEQKVIQRSDYIASRQKSFYDYIKNDIKKHAVFLQMTLAVGVDIKTESKEKEYDFVYFANNISKAADHAIEAFALAYKKNSSITLNISGSYDSAFKSSLEKRMVELGIERNVFITGSKQTHDEVIKQIKKSRYALLPLKVDLISGTIREAMGAGLPVVTTITPGTPNLNKERESVLLSPIGDYQAMADNMIKLVEDGSFAANIRGNALLTVRERYSNEAFMKMWRKAYYEILENFHHGKTFSEDVIYKG